MTGENSENIFSAIPENLPEELENLLASGGHFRFKRIVSRGHSSARNHWYDQDETEWVLLLSGSARLEFENSRFVAMTPGDHLTIPPHCRHRVAWTTPDDDTVWLALYFSGT